MRPVRGLVASATLLTTGVPPALAPDAVSAVASFVHYYTPQRMQQGHEAALDGPLYSWLIAPR